MNGDWPGYVRSVAMLVSKGLESCCLKRAWHFLGPARFLHVVGGRRAAAASMVGQIRMLFPSGLARTYRYCSVRRAVLPSVQNVVIEPDVF